LFFRALSDSTRSLSGVIEKSMELMTPLLLIVAIDGYFHTPPPQSERIDSA